MKKNSISKKSATDWERIQAMQDEDIDLSDIPEITAAQMSHAVLRVGGKPVPKGKVLIPLLLDADVVAYFQTQTENGDYAELMNDVLKAAMAH